jgi:spore maturation protein A
MLNFLWAFMILIGIVYAAFTGNLSAVTEAALDSAQEAVTLCITMAGVLAFWVGLMQIAESAGVMEKATEKIYPFLHFLFPRIPKEHPACQSIAANCIANFFGLGWAATPAGLQAMKDLDALEQERMYSQERKTLHRQRFDFSSDRIFRDNRGGEKAASTEMCTFLVLNISSLQLIPVTIIAYRSQYGSPNPTGIIGASIVATGISTLAGIIFSKIMSWMDQKRGF